MLEAAAAGGAVRRPDAEDFRRLAAAARLAAQASRCAAAGLAELAAKQRTALLRYVGIVPADKVSGGRGLSIGGTWGTPGGLHWAGTDGAAAARHAALTPALKLAQAFFPAGWAGK